MENSFIQKLCRTLIGSAFHRCRVSESICRVSIILKCCSDSDRPIVRISISDTGVGSSLEEFQDMDYTRDNVLAEKWDGLLFVKTTSISDTEVSDYCLNLKEKASVRRLTRLPTTSKNGGKFSGTEVSLSTYESIHALRTGIVHFLRKMLMLKIVKVAVDLMIDDASNTGSTCKNIFQDNGGLCVPFSMSNIECLVSGLEDHVLKHGSTLDKECQSCFASREHIKVGRGTSFSAEGLRNNRQVIEAIIIITELPEPSASSCLKACGTKTEVHYFEDFLPSTISQSLLNSLTSIEWKTYGLSLRSSVIADDGNPVLEWENLPQYCHIDIAIHCYQDQTGMPQVRQKIVFDRFLFKKAVKLAMDDLKEKHAGTLLSAQAIKVQSYAPDLASTLAGLIFSSKDLEFQDECISLLGLQLENTDKEEVQDCIKEKIIGIIGNNDRKPARNREATCLFEDETLQEVDDGDDEEDYADVMDI